MRKTDMTSLIHINPDYLDSKQARQAHYLSALAALNEARAVFVSDAAEHGQAMLPDDALYQRVRELEPDWRECAASLSEAERQTGVGRKLLTYYCQHAECLAGDYGVFLRCEKRRNGKRDEWYLCVDDVIALRYAMQD